jgi:CrcB protein
VIWLYVALGGAAGAVARLAVGAWALSVAGPNFPWATLLVNVAGSLLLGYLMAALPGSSVDAEMRALLAVGFCGSFTTFSTFGYEAVALWQTGAAVEAGVYVGASMVLGLLGVVAGLWLGGVVAG